MNKAGEHAYQMANYFVTAMNGLRAQGKRAALEAGWCVYYMHEEGEENTRCAFGHILYHDLGEEDFKRIIATCGSVYDVIDYMTHASIGTQGLRDKYTEYAMFLSSLQKLHDFTGNWRDDPLRPGKQFLKPEAVGHFLMFNNIRLSAVHGDWYPLKDRDMMFNMGNY